MLYTQNPYYNIWYIVDDQQTFNEYIREREMNVGRKRRRTWGKIKRVRGRREKGKRERRREQINTKKDQT